MRVNPQVEKLAATSGMSKTLREFMINSSHATRVKEVRFAKPHPTRRTFFSATFVSTGVGPGTKNMVYSCKPGIVLIVYLDALLES